MTNVQGSRVSGDEKKRKRATCVCTQSPSAGHSISIFTALFVKSLMAIDDVSYCDVICSWIALSRLLRFYRWHAPFLSGELGELGPVPRSRFQITLLGKLLFDNVVYPHLQLKQPISGLCLILYVLTRKIVFMQKPEQDMHGHF